MCVYIYVAWMCMYIIVTFPRRSSMSTKGKGSSVWGMHLICWMLPLATYNLIPLSHMISLCVIQVQKFGCFPMPIHGNGESYAVCCEAQQDFRVNSFLLSSYKCRPHLSLTSPWGRQERGGANS